MPGKLLKAAPPFRRIGALGLFPIAELVLGGTKVPE